MSRTALSALRRWLATTPVKAARRRAALAVRPLENRSVPAVTAAFAAGTLTVNSDLAGDTISIELVGGKVSVIGNGTAVPVTGAPAGGITPTALTAIVANGNGGDDSITVAATITDPAQLDGGTGFDSLTGGSGNDNITTGADVNGDLADGGKGNDTVTGGAGDDLLFGGAGNDSVSGGLGANVLEGGAGNDTLVGGLNDDDLTGGDGNDSLVGSDGADRLRGDTFGSRRQGNDSLDGGLGDDLLAGGGGNDVVFGGDGADLLDGGAGNDRLVAGDDTLDGDDTGYGGAGNDTMTGGDGLDALYGEAGNDSLTGGAGNDVLSGGLGQDFFVGHGADGDATLPDNFDTYQDEFTPTRPFIGRTPSVKGIAATELGIQTGLAALAAVANKPADFNFAGRIRYLGAGDYLVKLGPPDEISSDPFNPSPTGNQVVHFDGTWTDNEPRANGLERFPRARASSEFWTILYHRAMMQALDPAYDPTVPQTAVEYNAIVPNPGVAVETLTGISISQTFTFSGTTPPAGFSATDIRAMLAAGQWVTVRTQAVPVTAGLAGNQSYAVTAVSRDGLFITLYNPSGFDRGTSPSGPLDATGRATDDGFITISAADFFNSANFAQAWVN